MRRARPAVPAEATRPVEVYPYGLHAAPEPPPQEPVRNRRRARAVLVLFAAAAAMICVGAAATSRDVLARADKATLAATGAEAEAAEAPERPEARKPGAKPMAPDGTGTLVRDADGSFPGVRIEFGQLKSARDILGIAQVSLPVRVTNLAPAVRSYDIRVLARDGDGGTITEDTGTAMELRPGQAAEIRVLDIVNDAIAARLEHGSFEVAEVFAY
jgi:hypothetical protein